MNCVLFAKVDQVFSLKKKQQNNKKKIWEKWNKILEKPGNFVSPEKWEPWLHVARFKQSVAKLAQFTRFVAGLLESV